MKNMKGKFTIPIFVAAWLIFPPALAHTVFAEDRLNSNKIEELTGAKGKWNEKEGVFKVSVPRSDLNVTIDGIKVTPPMGLTYWAAFTKVGEHTMVMGDMVLLQDQVNPVLDVALENGLEVTSLPFTIT